MCGEINVVYKINVYSILDLDKTYNFACGPNYVALFNFDFLAIIKFY